MRSTLRLAVVGLAFALLAGCTTPATTSGTDGGPAPAPVPVVIAYNGAGCAESVGVILSDPAPVQAILPAGYKWRDAGDLLGLPQPTGMAAIGFNLVTCGEGQQAGAGEAFEGVYIHPPALANASMELPPSSLDFYQMAYFTGNATTLATLASFGVPVGLLQPGGEVTDAVAAATGEAAVRADGADVHAFRFVTAGSQPFAGLARFWTPTANGTAAFEYNVAQDASSGVLATCSFGAASPIAKSLGVTSCAGRVTMALRFPVQEWTGAIRLMPGVQAAA